MLSLTPLGIGNPSLEASRVSVDPKVEVRIFHDPVPVAVLCLQTPAHPPLFRSLPGRGDRDLAHRGLEVEPTGARR